MLTSLIERSMSACRDCLRSATVDADERDFVLAGKVNHESLGSGSGLRDAVTGDRAWTGSDEIQERAAKASADDD